MSTIRPTELDARLDDEDAPFVLDIRPEAHYERDAIDGSYNLPVYSDLQAGNEESLRGRLDEIPREREVVVVCKMGIVAKQATKTLNEEGYTAATLLGGINGWAGYQNNTIVYKLRSMLWKLR